MAAVCPLLLVIDSVESYARISCRIKATWFFPEYQWRDLEQIFKQMPCAIDFVTVETISAQIVQSLHVK